MYPNQYTLCSKAQTPNPKPQTPNPNSYTLHPKPQTPNPNPQPLTRNSVLWTTSLLAPSVQTSFTNPNTSLLTLFRSFILWDRRTFSCRLQPSNTLHSAIHTATHDNALQHIALQHTDTLQHAADRNSLVDCSQATHCNVQYTLQYTAAHCNTLQRTATYCTATH